MPRVLLTVFLLASAFYARLPASGEGFSEEEKAWWAVQPIGDPEVPASARAGHPIDAFVAERRNDRRNDVGRRAPIGLADQTVEGGIGGLV